MCYTGNVQHKVGSYRNNAQVTALCQAGVSRRAFVTSSRQAAPPVDTREARVNHAVMVQGVGTPRSAAGGNNAENNVFRTPRRVARFARRAVEWPTLSVALTKVGRPRG